MTDDKFIMFGLDDDRSKDIADVLGNKTCKKIIDYLSDVKEASEKDIADALAIPINTVEYNLNKLIRTGLIEKTKNFFWSKKGRKIEMYKLAKKHIVISPKPKKVDLNALKTVLPIILAAIAAIVILAALFFIPHSGTIYSNGNETELKQFNSLDEIKVFLNSASQDQRNAESFNSAQGVTKSTAPSIAAGSSADSSSSSHSNTNIQVEGVDEADIVKNDGKYIYTLNGEKIVIVNAYPPEQMNIASEIKISNARNMFVNEDKLIVFGENYEYTAYDSNVVSSLAKCLALEGCGTGYSESKSRVYIYDISDRTKPVLESNMSFDGNYADSRMIGDYVYLISTKYIYRDGPIVPMYEINGVKSEVALSSIYYSPYVDNNYVFTSISAINLDNNEINSKTYLTGSTGVVYVSQDNVYITYQKSYNWYDYGERKIKEVYLEIAPEPIKSQIQNIIDSNNDYYSKESKVYDIITKYSMSLTGAEKEKFDKSLQEGLIAFEKKLQEERDRTIVHKIKVDESEIEYKAAGEFPGHLLNQFSMDEFDGNFRVATTSGEVWNGNSLNNIYVLDSNLKIIGELEDLAKGETIYSARFMGKRAYIVTFKKVDPLFVIDLSDAKNPEVLGYLKIPGYSNYLHPYDDNHVIGIGKDAVDASDEQTSGRNLDFAWYQGVKISLFDVSDVENPIEKAKIIIGDRGTDSIALSDHKALLFDKDKKLLVLPISLAEINRSKYHSCTENEINNYNNYCLTSNTYGETTWQGAYVLNIDLNEISLRGKISHNEISSEKFIAAKQEPVGATRKDANGNIWTKTDSNEYGQWKSSFSDYAYNDYDIDSFPGGINYNPAYDYSRQIQRTLYMDDFLYTISQSKVKVNDLNLLNEIGSLNLGYTGFHNRVF